MTARAILFVALALAALTAAPSAAVQPDEVLPDPGLEARAREISRTLRCLVCQNQSIDYSEAGLARDLRLLVRERLVGGDSDAQTIDFVVARYGDFVLLDPPFKASTLALWFGPAAIALTGLGGVLLFYRNRRLRAAPVPPLTDDERRRLDVLAGETGDGRQGREEGGRT